ncbi:Homeodomain-like protein, partial [Gautieria morchelliformis]
EPPVKKKRKRADANQLRVLNATYQRTAFPSTQERESLAKELDMSPRSVQIWFQNKRQSMRQSRSAPALPP